MVQNKDVEHISAVSAAQRLGESVERVKELYESKKLKGFEQYGVLYIEKDSLLTYSGLSPTAHQTAPRRGRPAKKQEEVAQAVLPKTVEAKAPSQDEVCTTGIEVEEGEIFTRKEMRQLTEVAYLRGKLAGYETAMRYNTKESA